MRDLKNKKKYFLGFIFLASLAFMLFFNFQTPHFSDDGSYFNLRYIEHIQENKFPMIYDDLSYGGRTVFVSPLFHYFMVLFSFIPYGLKILPALLVALNIFVVYLLASYIVKDRISALLAAFMAGFLPGVLSVNLNQLSAFSLFLPVAFYMIYCLMRIEDKKFLDRFVILCFLLPLIHPTALLVSLSLIFYIVLVYSDPDLKLSAFKKEAILFSIFLILLIEFIIFKKAFLELGLNIVWQNTPTEIILEYFKNVNFLELVLDIGVMPFIFGIIGIMFGLFRDKKHSILLFSSIILSTLMFVFFRTVDFSIGLMFLSVSLCIASAVSFRKMFRYLKITKFSKFEGFIVWLLVGAIVVSLVWPAFLVSREIVSEAVTDDQIEILKLIKEKSLDGDMVIAPISEGHLVTYVTGRKNFMDSNYLFIPRIDRRYNDMEEIYTTISSQKAANLLLGYDIAYVYVSPRIKKDFGIEGLRYAVDEKCFRKIGESGGVTAYATLC